MTPSLPRVLILGASGMLGSTLFRLFSSDPLYNTYGTLRKPSARNFFPCGLHNHLISNVHIDDDSHLLRALSLVQPDLIINCIGLIKQLPNATDPLSCLLINSVLPHRIARHSSAIGARLVHISTDCVFSGKDGPYKETDLPDASDLYGRTKLLGELDYPNTITLRTSLIGHELNSTNSLVDWFLSQSDQVKGFSNAIFSGLPTIEVSRVIKDIVLPNTSLTGLYHLSAAPISKLELLKLIAATYSKSILILPSEQPIIDRSLNSDRFRTHSGYIPQPWSVLIREMHTDYSHLHPHPSSFKS